MCFRLPNAGALLQSVSTEGFTTLTFEETLAALKTKQLPQALST
jgi:hypothetical protein